MVWVEVEEKPNRYIVPMDFQYKLYNRSHISSANPLKKLHIYFETHFEPRLKFEGRFMSRVAQKNRVFKRKKKATWWSAYCCLWVFLSNAKWHILWFNSCLRVFWKMYRRSNKKLSYLKICIHFLQDRN